MGGKALKNTFTRRYQRAEFEQLVGEVRAKFDTKLDEHVVAMPVPYYQAKPDFGDMDLVVLCPPEYHLTETVKELFAPNEIVRNGEVTSFDYKAFQIDLIRFSDRKTSEFALQYFAFNDLGNFIGRTAHRLGFKFGHDGLWYMFRDPECETRLISELVITTNFKQALEFLGFDYATHVRGFDTPDDVFEYATTSRYFDPAQFNLSNRSCEARRRDRTRQMYQNILVFLNKKYGLTGEEKPTPVDRNEHLMRAFECFPEFKTEYNAAKKRYEVVKKYKANFNGDNYSTWFGFGGEALGQLMASHRAYFTKHNLMEWIGSLSSDAFRDLVLALELHKVFDHELPPTR